ncbi:MAG: TonB-dependent receptor plug domain-containing protein [Verrucomicrobiae bacterium]|nr:TonB-dependent receptor plug domain-containing protein [Verrucomicrobiae bacterium]
MAGAVGSLMGLPLATWGQGETGIIELEPMVVVGSWIPRMEGVTSSPVEVIEADVLRRVAATDVMDALRKTQVGFLGSDNIGREVNNGGSGESRVALRNLPTLVLLNGRRLANSALSNGSAVDLNTVPVSMIERIEVLKDGASAIYGADAIGGVVNVVLKKGYHGAEVGGQYGFTTRGDGYQEYSAWVTGGFSNDRSSITAGARYHFNDPLWTRDRAVASYGISELTARGLYPASYISPTYPGRVDGFVLAGSPYAQGHPRYDPGMVTVPERFLGGVWTIEDLVEAGVYIPLAETPQGSELADAGWTLFPLNNTAEDTYSILRQDRRQVAMQGEHALFDDRLVLYGDFLFADHRSTGALAAAPAFSLGGNQVSIPADNPYNPFGVTLGAGGLGSPRVTTRFTNLGPRYSESDTSYYRVLAGLRGRLDEPGGGIEDIAWSTGFNYNRSDQRQITRNAPSVPALNLALTPDFAADPSGRLSLLRTAAGVALPTYDYFGLPGNPRNDPRTLEAIRAGTFRDGASELLDADLLVSARAIELPAGKVAFAVGGLFRWESLSTTYDFLTRNGLALGVPASGDFPGGGRRTWAGFVETGIPVVSPDMAVPGVASLEIAAAGRFEWLDPGGSTQVPKVGIKWEPVGDQVALRGTYSRGFIAPSLFELYGSPQESYPLLSLPDGFGQVQYTQFADPNLRPATAAIWTGGVVWTPERLRGLTLSLDYYRIDNPGISTFDFQSYANSLNALGSASPFASGFMFGDGTRLSSTAPNQVTVANWGNADIVPTPGLAQRTDGLDLGAAYEWRTDTAGTFQVGASANILLNYEFRTTPGGPFHGYGGQYTDIFTIPGGQGTLPDWNLALRFAWEYRDLTFSVFSRYIPGVEDLGVLHPAIGEDYHGYTLDDRKWDVAPWFTVDLQLAYEFGRSRPGQRWADGLRVAVGCQNVSDEEVSLVPSSSEDNTDKSTYNILGRLVYFQVSKRF